MGHTWREMCPAEAEASDNYFARMRKLREALANVSLGEFTVAELGAVMRLQSLERGFSGARDLSDDDFKLLERKVASLTSRRKAAAPRRRRV